MKRGAIVVTSHPEESADAKCQQSPSIGFSPRSDTADVLFILAMWYLREEELLMKFCSSYLWKWWEKLLTSNSVDFDWGGHQMTGPADYYSCTRGRVIRIQHERLVRMSQPSISLSKWWTHRPAYSNLASFLPCWSHHNLNPSLWTSGPYRN